MIEQDSETYKRNKIFKLDASNTHLKPMMCIEDWNKPKNTICTIKIMRNTIFFNLFKESIIVDIEATKKCSSPRV